MEIMRFYFFKSKKLLDHLNYSSYKISKVSIELKNNLVGIW